VSPGEWFEPRDRVAAARSAAVLMVVAALVILCFAAVDPSIESGWQRVAVLASAAAAVPLAWLVHRRGHRAPAPTWVALPAGGVVLITALDFATRDASAAGQVFLAFPVLFASSQLRRGAAIGITVLTVAADALLALGLLPVERALTDVAFVGATLGAMTALLVVGGEQRDALVTRLTTLAAVDPLTGLATRRVLDEAADAALGCEGRSTALLVLDLDRFKVINDSRGHPVGDDALAHVAALLRSKERPGMVLSRLGGDELAVLVTGCAPGAAESLAEEVAHLVRSRPLVTADGPLPLSVSIGVAYADDGATTLRAMYSAADAALYRAKTGGRDRVVVSDGTAVEPDPGP
jgi:diguanylate cyclase (GGDEF)-like protein